MSDQPVNEEDDDLLDHYDIDFSKAKPNRFAPLFAPLKSGGRAVYLDPEVAERFTTSEEVNRLLKALLQTMPYRRRKLPSRKKFEGACCFCAAERISRLQPTDPHPR